MWWERIRDGWADLKMLTRDQIKPSRSFPEIGKGWLESQRAARRGTRRRSVSEASPKFRSRSTTLNNTEHPLRISGPIHLA